MGLGLEMTDISESPALSVGDHFEGFQRCLEAREWKLLFSIFVTQFFSYSPGASCSKPPITFLPENYFRCLKFSNSSKIFIDFES